MFNNTKEAFSLLVNDINKNGVLRENYSARSKEKKIKMKEIIGARIKLENTNDALEVALGLVKEKSIEDIVIEKQDEKEKKEKWLTGLAEDFIDDNILNFKGDEYYTYNERIAGYKNNIIKNIEEKVGENNRQAFLSIWDRKDVNVLGKKEVPCSIGYHFLERDDQIHMVYYMRSCDINIWPNDVYLSSIVHDHICDKVWLPKGNVVFLIGSLHMFLEG